MTEQDKVLLYQELDNYFNKFNGLESSNCNGRIDSINVYSNGIVDSTKHFSNDIVDFTKHFIEWQKKQLVEKGINFLNYKLGDIVAIRMPGTIIPHHVTKQDLIEDFKNYMKGE